MEIVEVEWVDAVKEEAHITKDCACKLMPIERWNVGYLIEESKKGIVITWGVMVNLYKDEQAIDEGFLIPHALIKKVRRLK